MDIPIIQKVREGLASLLELPKDIALGLPVITITGRDEATVTNYTSIVELSDSMVRINSECGFIIITGEHIVLKQLTDDYIKLSGKLAAAQLTGRNEP